MESECVCEGGEEAGDSDKKDGGSGAKSDSDRKKSNKGQYLLFCEIVRLVIVNSSTITLFQEFSSRGERGLVVGGMDL